MCACVYTPLKGSVVWRECKGTDTQELNIRALTSGSFLQHLGCLWEVLTITSCLFVCHFPISPLPLIHVSSSSWSLPLPPSQVTSSCTSINEQASVVPIMPEYLACTTVVCKQVEKIISMK